MACASVLKTVSSKTRSDGPPLTHSAVHNFETNVALHQLVDFYKSVNVPVLLQHVLLGEQLTARFAATAFSAGDSSITINLHLEVTKDGRCSCGRTSETVVAVVVSGP
ncbi:hypothetical protein HPB50_016911 [Hyalomma asiaticum]|uniref:Uncharacterized protein n=1 Tax=Hyalomma asiaticum TaxID=266040 RepID=A0ACB7T5D0_HYAAI|nr:hypothetical protein HPB50_016911 [Hyalomma asiaticum]